MWQPINTAPKDGTHVLAYRAPLGIRTTNMTNPPTVVHWFDDPETPGFYTSVNELAPERPFNPTHWMLLPDPPQPVDIIERLRWSISADTPARYPDIVNDAISEIERSRTALQTSLVAMRMASRLPGVSDEYDFEPAIAEVTAAMSGTR